MNYLVKVKELCDQLQKTIPELTTIQANFILTSTGQQALFETITITEFYINVLTQYLDSTKEQEITGKDKEKIKIIHEHYKENLKIIKAYEN